MYLGKKGELVSLLALGLLILAGSLIFLKSGGITGAVIGTEGYTVQATHLISTCQALNVSGDTYRLTSDVSSPTSGPNSGNCFRFLNYSITLDCDGFNITYSDPVNDAGRAIMANRSGPSPPTIGNLTIMNCNFEDGTMKDPGAYAIFIHNTKNVTITNNYIYSNILGSNGILLSNAQNVTLINNRIVTKQGGDGLIVSDTSTSTFIDNNISTDDINDHGLIINGTLSQDNVFYNLRIDIDADETGDTALAINHSNNVANSLIYNNTFGLINWSSKTNLTVVGDLILGEQIFQAQNLSGLSDNQNLQQLNSSAKIEIRNLTYAVKPHLLKNGVRCDDTDFCNITYNSGSGILFANISSFSNYSTRNQVNLTECWDLELAGQTYKLINSLTSTGTCISILNENITLDCQGFYLNYSTSGAAGDMGINNTGGHDNVTIKNCPITSKAGGLGPSDRWSIHFRGVSNSTIFNNTITSNTCAGYTLLLDNSSDNNISRNVHNNPTANNGGDPALPCGDAVFLNGTSINNKIFYNNITTNRYALRILNNSEGNYFLNTNLSGQVSTRIIDDIHTSSGTNSLVYNNTFGMINWTKTNLTTNLSLRLNITIFLNNNSVGLADSSNAYDNINGTAKIEIRNLAYSSTPQLLKDGVRCDDTDLCNITYNSGSSILFANISSFSNYTTSEADPPAVNITNPANGSNFSTGLQTFNATVIDTSNISAVIFMFKTNGTPFNITASNTTGFQWNATVNVSTIVEGTHVVSVFANDTAGNVNQSVNITIFVDRTAPNVSIISPASGSTFSNQLQTFNVSVKDLGPGNTSVDTVLLMFKTNTTPFNVTLTNTSGNWNATVDMSTIVEDTHTVTVFANDSAGNVNQTETLTFSVDRTVNAGSPSSSSPQPSSESSAPAAAETTPTPPAQEEVETIGDLTISVSTPVSTNGADESQISIYNGGNEVIELDAKLKDDFVLENKENIGKKLAQQGLSDEEIEEELEAIRLIEKLEVLQAHTGKIFSLFSSSGILKPTGNHVKAGPLKNQLINENELQGIIVLPGQTFNGRIILQKGLTLSPEDIEVVFSTKNQEVFKKDFISTKAVIGTEFEVVDKDKKLVDLYIQIPPVKGEGIGTYSVELDFNKKGAVPHSAQKIPLKVSSPFQLFSTDNSVDSKIFGPYTVSLEKGALIAGQYEVIRSGKYSVISRTYKGGTKLVAENTFELDLS